MLSKIKNPFMAMIIFALILVTSIFGGTPNAELAKKLAMADLNHQFLQAVQGKIDQLAESRQFRQKIIDYAPEKKIAAFLKAVEEAKANGIDTAQLLKAQTEKTKGFSAGVAGTVELTGAEVFAFGSHGFFAGYAKANAAGEFSIDGLKPGEYFLYTKSDSYYAYKPFGATVHAEQFASMLTLNFSDLKTVELNLGTTQQDGAIISGLVTDTAGDSLNFVFVVAYNTADTSFATLTISFFGPYELANLEPGSYILYADSYFDFELPGIPLNARLGQYFEGVSTPDEATVLTVASDDTLTDKNFVLEMGGAISGTVKDETGAAVDSVFVIALKDIDLNLDNFSGFFLENIDFAVTVTDANGNYVAPGLRTGDYIVGTLSLLNSNFGQLFAEEPIFLGKHAGRVLDEYYTGVQSIFDIAAATRVSVTESDTTENINFDLELAGSISGNFTDVSTGGAVQGEGIVIAFNEVTGLPQLAFTLFDSLTGAYSTQPLRTGSYKLLGIVTQGAPLGGVGTSKPFFENNLIDLAQQDDILYLPQFYNGKATLDAADAVAVTPPTPTSGINFNMLRVATIAGTVNLPAGIGIPPPDSLEIIVTVFDSQTGELSASTSIYAGEPFKLFLPEGTYKVAAMGLFPGVAVAYAGGGSSFDDPNSTEIILDFGQVVDNLSITLAPELGVISGTVVNDEDSEPLPRVLVLAYDETGHAVASGVTGIDILTGQPSADLGAYSISGLADGNYHVRTFFLFRFLNLLDDNIGGDAGADPLTLILGLLGGGDDNQLSDLSLTVYQDAWYDGSKIATDLGDIDIFSIFLGVFFGGGDTGSILPFFSTPTSDAMTVAVNSSGETDNINFRLSELDLNLTSVEESGGQIPADFALEQNYPNPFNPTTVVSYKVPATGHVSLQIYNVLGQKIKTLFKGVKSAGAYNLQWNGLNEKGQQVAAGIYVVRLESGNSVLARKMLLIK